MTTITEDYVSFETAKLLKEKGFNWGCYQYYNFNNGNLPTMLSFRHQNGDIELDEHPTAPTLQMARKWLRLKYNIYIDVHLSFAEDPENHPSMYYVYILDAKTGNSLLEKAAHIGELNPLTDINDHNVPINFDSPEEAADVAIRYCLENLI